ncbi:hypothetical protein HY415_00675 [Candidatus Kaiserbacteria bacterium]|nr:hypothetical protein [Candidatus Kaiserbacteria bacterium]
MKSPFIHAVLAYSLCILTIIAYGFWYAAVEAKSAAVAHLEDQIAVKTEAARHIAYARASLAEIAGDEASIRDYFVSETGVVAFINNLEEQGRVQGADVNVASVSMSNAGASPMLTFSITVQGTFDAVMRTVGAIEYAPYDLSISAFSLARNTKGDWRADVGLLVGSVSADTTTRTP